VVGAIIDPLVLGVCGAPFVFLFAATVALRLLRVCTPLQAEEDGDISLPRGSHHKLQS